MTAEARQATLEARASRSLPRQTDQATMSRRREQEEQETRRRRCRSGTRDTRGHGLQGDQATLPGGQQQEEHDGMLPSPSASGRPRRGAQLLRHGRVDRCFLGTKLRSLGAEKGKSKQRMLDLAVAEHWRQQTRASRSLLPRDQATMSRRREGEVEAADAGSGRRRALAPTDNRDNRTLQRQAAVHALD